jgi:hypothetical protein
MPPRLPSKKLGKLEGAAKFSKMNYQLLPRPAYSPSSQIPSHEIYYIEYFVLCNRSVSGYFGSSLWNKTIFQISHSESSIRDALISLAILLRNQSLALYEVDSQKARLSYAKAVQALNRRLDGSSFCWLLALICSLLFAAFEALGGTDIAALQHFWAGFAMLKEHASRVLVCILFKPHGSFWFD